MRKKRRKTIKTRQKRSPEIDTIVIVGNGFDLWQGLHTSYSQFQQYYLAHRENILKKHHIKKHIFIDQDGRKIECSDVELVYGDPFEPGELEDEFWSTFEASLDQLDPERLNFFFGKEKSDLREMRRCIKNAGRILREAFCNWIATIHIEAEDAGYEFGDHCLFINFNYTDTLQKRFTVEKAKEFHIHGEAADKKSIIYGHSSHPQEPEPLLARFGGRFLGLYYVDEILYETDKHCQDNIRLLCMFLAAHAAINKSIKNIYVLGHSMGPADIAYFDFLVRSTQAADADPMSPEKDAKWHISYYSDRDQERIELVMKKLGCRNYELYSSIDDCLEPFRKEYLSIFSE